MKERRLISAGSLFALFLGSATLLCPSVAPPAHAEGYGGASPHGGLSPHGKDYSHHGKSSEHHKQYAHGSGHSGMGHAGMGKHHGLHQDAHNFIDHILKFKEGMGITEEQEKQLEAIENAYKRSQIQLKAKVELANLDLHELLHNEEDDLSAIREKLNAVMEAEGNLLMASIKAKREAKAVLTEEQRKRMNAIHERIKSYGKKGMKSGHPGGYPHHSKKKSESHS